jgi:hypothetical protein
MPVRFGFRRGAGSLTERDITNDAGIARCYVERIVDFSRSVVIEAAVPHPLAEDEVIEKLTRVYTYGRLSPLEQPQRIFVHFGEPRFARPGRIETLLSGLVTAFEEAGFSNTETTYMEEPTIFTRAFGGDPPTIDLLSGPATAGTLLLCMVGAPRTTQQSSDFHRSLISVQLRFIEPESRMVTFEDEVEGRGAGATADEAERRAFRRGLEAVLQSIDTHLTDMRRKHGF